MREIPVDCAYPSYMEENYVVATCHDGTGWCVREATIEELVSSDEEKFSLGDAREHAAKVAKEDDCIWFDFSSTKEIAGL